MPSTRSVSRPLVARVGFVIKHRQPQAAAFAVQLARWLLERNAEVLFCDETPGIAKPFKRNRSVKVVKKPKLTELCDLIVVIGGDGTYLSIARLMEKRSVPLMGVNMGQLGFLTEIKKEEALEVLSKIIDRGEIEISSRTMLEATLQRKRREILSIPIVNDVVVAKGAIARMISLKISVNGKEVAPLRADGLIVSTPTGSTAYSLAAGGPILEPSLRAMILTAICPHSLAQRALVVPDDSKVVLELQNSPGSVLVTFDGQEVVEMKEGDRMIVRRYRKHALKLVTSPTRDYFGLLREKLKFGIRA